MLDITRSKRTPAYIFVFLAPAVVVYSLFMIYPLLDSLRLSFFTFTEDNRQVWNGIANYSKLLSDSEWAPRFWGALGNNLLFFCIHMAEIGRAHV